MLNNGPVNKGSASAAAGLGARLESFCPACLVAEAAHTAMGRKAVLPGPFQCLHLRRALPAQLQAPSPLPIAQHSLCSPAGRLRTHPFAWGHPQLDTGHSTHPPDPPITSPSAPPAGSWDVFSSQPQVLTLHRLNHLKFNCPLSPSLLPAPDTSPAVAGAPKVS